MPDSGHFITIATIMMRGDLKKPSVRNGKDRPQGKACPMTSEGRELVTQYCHPLHDFLKTMASHSSHLLLTCHSPHEMPAVSHDYIEEQPMVLQKAFLNCCTPKG